MGKEERVEGGILVRKREDRYDDEDGEYLPKRRGMRELPVVGEPMGIEAAEKPLVGTPGGDPTALVSAPTFPSLRSSPALAAFLFGVGRESYKSSKADRAALYHVSSFLSPSSLRAPSDFAL